MNVTKVRLWRMFETNSGPEKWMMSNFLDMSRTW